MITISTIYIFLLLVWVLLKAHIHFPGKFDFISFVFCAFLVLLFVTLLMNLLGKGMMLNVIVACITLVFVMTTSFDILLEMRLRSWAMMLLFISVSVWIIMTNTCNVIENN